jgi:hypothetical protein
MAIRTRFHDPKDYIIERSTPTYEADLRDTDGSGIPASALVTLTLTLYDLTSSGEAIINSVNGQNILNADRGVVDSLGHVVVQFQSLDMAILDASHLYERRLALFQWTYGLAGIFRDAHEVELVIWNLSKIP